MLASLLFLLSSAALERKERPKPLAGGGNSEGTARERRQITSELSVSFLIFQQTVTFSSKLLSAFSFNPSLPPSMRFLTAIKAISLSSVLPEAAVIALNASAAS